MVLLAFYWFCFAWYFFPWSRRSFCVFVFGICQLRQLTNFLNGMKSFFIFIFWWFAWIFNWKSTKRLLIPDPFYQFLSIPHLLVIKSWFKWSLMLNGFFSFFKRLLEVSFLVYFDLLINNQCFGLLFIVRRKLLSECKLKIFNVQGKQISFRRAYWLNWIII